MGCLYIKEHSATNTRETIDTLCKEPLQLPNIHLKLLGRLLCRIMPPPVLVAGLRFRSQHQSLKIGWLTDKSHEVGRMKYE